MDSRVRVRTRVHLLRTRTRAPGTRTRTQALENCYSSNVSFLQSVQTLYYVRSDYYESLRQTHDIKTITSYFVRGGRSVNRILIALIDNLIKGLCYSSMQFLSWEIRLIFWERQFTHNFVAWHILQSSCAMQLPVGAARAYKLLQTGLRSNCIRRTRVVW